MYIFSIVGIIEIINAIQTIAFDANASFSGAGPIAIGNKIIIEIMNTIIFIKSLIVLEYIFKSFIINDIKIFL